jgi:hypothetical protein
MDIYNTILEDNEKKCASFDRTNARKILVLYRELNTYIGDLCLRVDKLWRIKEYFPDAILDFNFTFAKQQWIYDGLLRNSPCINKLFSAELEDCDFSEYDLIIYVDADEMSLLNVFSQRYEKYGAGNYAPPVFSMTTTVFRADRVNNIKFPLYEDLIANLWDTKGELYVSNEEREWAEKWLRDRGVNQDDPVIVVLDTSSGKSKLLNVPVYFDFIQFLLRGKRIKVLNFDERGIGKEDFYKAWLGNQTDNLIFSKNLSLREVLCILSARYIKMIFGPCTGLMHCSSAIYNYYKKMGMGENDIPIMITYTGKYPEEQNPAEWWENQPLVDCIMLKSRGNAGCSLVKLSDLSPEEQTMNDSLPVTHYTADHLINFVHASFQKRSLSLW